MAKFEIIKKYKKFDQIKEENRKDKENEERKQIKIKLIASFENLLTFHFDHLKEKGEINK